MSLLDEFANEVIKRVHKINPDIDAETIAVIAGVALGCMIEELENQQSCEGCEGCEHGNDEEPWCSLGNCSREERKDHFTPQQKEQ